MTRFVVDASVVAKWLFPEPMSDIAAPLLIRAREGELDLVAPRLLVYEYGSLILKKLRNGLASSDDAALAVERFPALPVRLVSDGGEATEALRIAETAVVSFYDAAYVALADLLRSALLTADGELVRRVRQAGMAHLVLPLSEFAH